MPFQLPKIFDRVCADLTAPRRFFNAEPLSEEPDSFLIGISPSVTFIETLPHASAMLSPPLRRASEFPSPCRSQSQVALEALFTAIRAEQFDVAAELVTKDPHLLYCWGGGHTALASAIDADSPTAPLLLARALANQKLEGVQKLKGVLRQAIEACRASRNCTLLASVFQALIMARGDGWLEQRLPRVGDATPVATTRRRLQEVAEQDLGDDADRADVQDFLQHGVADLVMIALSRRMAAFEPSLAIGFDLFNRDERVLMALQQNAAVLQARSEFAGHTDDKLVALLSEVRTVVGAMTQRTAPTRRASIHESVSNLASLLDA